MPSLGGASTTNLKLRQARGNMPFLHGGGREQWPAPEGVRGIIAHRSGCWLLHRARAPMNTRRTTIGCMRLALPSRPRPEPPGMPRLTTWGLHDSGIWDNDRSTILCAHLKSRALEVARLLVRTLLASSLSDNFRAGCQRLGRSGSCACRGLRRGGVARERCGGGGRVGGVQLWGRHDARGGRHAPTVCCVASSSEWCHIGCGRLHVTNTMLNGSCKRAQEIDGDSSAVVLINTSAR